MDSVGLSTDKSLVDCSKWIVGFSTDKSLVDCSKWIVLVSPLEVFVKLLVEICEHLFFPPKLRYLF